MAIPTYSSVQTIADNPQGYALGANSNSQQQGEQAAARASMGQGALATAQAPLTPKEQATPAGTNPNFQGNTVNQDAVAAADPNQAQSGVSVTQTAPDAVTQVNAQRTAGTVVDPQITKVSQQVSNRAAGVGNGISGNVPQPPVPPQSQTQTQLMSENSDRLAFDMNKVPKWNESDAFSMGMINFGVSLLAGNDIYSSLNSASSKFQEAYGQEKRTAWAEDLRKKGYDENEIQSWIASGNNKDLTDPMEKKMKIMQYNQAAMNLDKAKYENSPEMRNYNMSHQKWEDQMKVQAMKDQEAQQAASLAIQRAHLAIAQKEANAKLAAGKGDNPFGLDNRTLSRVQQQVKPYYDKVMNKTSQFSMATNAINEAKRLRAAGAPESQVTAQYNIAKEAYARGMKGTFTGGISPKEVDEYAGNPNLIKGGFASGLVALGGNVPDYELERLGQATSGAHDSELKTFQDFQANQYDQLSREIGPQRAAQVMSVFNTTGGDHALVSGDQRGTANPRTVQIQR